MALLLVSLHDGLGPHLRAIGILTGRATGPALPQEVPALVEGHLERSEACQLVTRQTGVGVRPFQLVLLVGQLADPAHEFLVIHGELPLRRTTMLAELTGRRTPAKAGPASRL